MILLTKQSPWQGKRPLVMALGMFDGVHLAHSALISRCVALAQELDGAALVHTFLRNPQETLRPEGAPKRLQPIEARVRAIEALKPDALVLLPFSRAYGAQSPEAFVEALVAAYGPAHLVVGYDYSFGRKGLGTPALLMDLGRRLGFTTQVLPAMTREGQVISSTRIREALSAGDVQQAAALLGKPYALYGHVDRSGRLRLDPRAALPAPGAYRVSCNGVPARLVLAQEARLWGGAPKGGGWVRVLLMERL